MDAPGVNEVFEFEGKLYKCVESGDDCEGCAFNKENELYCYAQFECYAEDRPDEKEVIFKEVK